MFWTWGRAASMSADGAHYMELAERSWRLGPGAGMDWYAGPGYTVIVGWVFALVGDLDFAGRLTSFVFGLATLVGVGILSYRMFGGTVAGIAVGLLAVHTTFVRHTVMAETDSAYGCWLVWSILFTWELKHAAFPRRQALWATLAGVSLGCGYLTRPEAVPLAGLLGLWYLFGQRRKSESENVASVTRTVQPLNRSTVQHFSTSTPQPLNLERRHASFVRRVGWSLLMAAIFVVVASPYLLKLRADLGRWSLSGKERSIVLKFVPDKRNYEEVLKLGVSGALLKKPSNILHWLPYHIHWGVPQFVKSLNPVVLPLAMIGVFCRRWVSRRRGGVGLLLWVSVPFILFFFLTFPGRRYFMQVLPQWTILAAVGTIELAGVVASWRARLADSFRSTDPALRYRRAFRIALATPVVLLAGSTLYGNWTPIEQSLITERAIGERIQQISGPGRRVLSFTVAAFYARGERVPLWGPMEGIVRCHGYGEPLDYDELVSYVRRHRVEYVVLDEDLRADCPEFLNHVRAEDFELVADDIVDQHGPHFIYRFVGQTAQNLHAN